MKILAKHFWVLWFIDCFQKWGLDTFCFFKDTTYIWSQISYCTTFSCHQRRQKLNCEQLIGNRRVGFKDHITFLPYVDYMLSKTSQQLALTSPSLVWKLLTETYGEQFSCQGEAWGRFGQVVGVLRWMQPPMKKEAKLISPSKHTCLFILSLFIYMFNNMFYRWSWTWKSSLEKRCFAKIWLTDRSESRYGTFK